MKVLIVIGTRPEAIKLAPVVSALRADARFEVEVCVTAQHRKMLDDVLDVFAIVPVEDLGVMRPDQDLFHVTTAVLNGMRAVLRRRRPDWVLVQGDTTTTFAAALAAAYERIQVGHVEAGLRTGNRGNPFPEEINRMLAACVTDLHFAPTPQAVENLRREGHRDQDIVMTGNTVLDALYETIARCRDRHFPEIDCADRNLLLVTAHRRENFGAGIHAIAVAVKDFAARHPDWCVIWPVHPNPNISAPVRQTIPESDNIRLLEPLRYDAFVHVLQRANLVLTDSGGVLEEAASIGKYVLVTRCKTERSEAVQAGRACLVAVTHEEIGQALTRTAMAEAWRQKSAGDWYGDGKAAVRIRDALAAREIADRAAAPTIRDIRVACP